MQTNEKALHIGRRIPECFRRDQEKIYRSTDRMFAILLGVEWLGAILTALWISPRTWSGSYSSIHPHVWAAVYIGCAVACVPAYCVYAAPGRVITRHVIALCQILMSVLLIDVTGGRIETHFHVFGSLAFLSFYRDWKVLITASAVTAIDHIVRGIWWPQSVYGALTVSPLRWVEHAWWVAFEDFFLILSIRRTVAEMWTVARQEATLSYEANHDLLTGLPNRLSLQGRFEAHLSRARRFGTRLAVAFIDLDRFKQLNDTYGHARGDRLLAVVGRTLLEKVRKTDTVARIGGDEFLIILDDMRSAEHARSVMRTLLSELDAALHTESGTISVTASMGVSLYPDHGQDPESLQAAADQAMYYAKAQGRNNTVLFSSNISDKAYRMAELERDLRHALSRGEMEVHYQPQVNPSGKIIGMEALARWKHPKRGFVPPGEFIAIAEGTGLIDSIGEWVLAESCRQGALWTNEGRGAIKIAVNVSALQLARPTFAAMVQRVLNSSGFDPRLLELEITESTFMKESPQAMEQLETLRRMHIHVAIDDFGTGYSSLSYLQRLPANRLKMDRSFVAQLLESERALPMIEAVVTMAHQLGMTVVAEGVESREQQEVLCSIGCDVLQGFLFSKPVPASKALGLLSIDSVVNDTIPEASEMASVDEPVAV